MGRFYVGCRVLNPVTSKSTVLRRLMVDTGAESTWIDATVLETIGIERRKKDLAFQLANGRSLRARLGMPFSEWISRRQSMKSSSPERAISSFLAPAPWKVSICRWILDERD